VLELVTRHLTNKEIAFAMGIGQETVKWHMKNLFLKLDATSRKQIVRRAQLMGLLQERPERRLSPPRLPNLDRDARAYCFGLPCTRRLNG
jgi:Response regulator containing a CheY-like receiver domain and an HTH DNA-binding domain